MTNREWIAGGKTGCTFATLFAKDPQSVGWVFIDYEQFGDIPDDALVLSISFPEDWTKAHVHSWALGNGFFEQETSNDTIGLRIECEQGISWVQYFGPDSHVVTRQAPQPMLLYTRKLGASHYVKVGWKGILHLAHAWTGKITERIYDLLWDRSYKQTCKKLGKSPTIREGAKTTWLK